MKRAILSLSTVFLLQLTADAQYAMNLPVGLRTSNGLPADSKYFNVSGQPYATTDEVILELPLASRGIGLTVNVNGLEYWFRDDVTDDNLVLKLPLWNGMNGPPGVVLFASSPTTIQNEWALRWDASNKALGVGFINIHSTGSSNTFVGMNAGNYSIPSSSYGGNTALGSNALANLTEGYTNTALGLSAGHNITIGNLNALVGHSAGNNITTGNGNTFIGSSAGTGNLSGDDNVALGRLSAGGYGLTGNGNVFLGSALYGITTGSKNIMIGNNLTAQSPAANGQLNIQNIIFGIGNTATGTDISTGNIGIGISNPTANFHVQGSTKLEGSVTLPVTGNGILIKEGVNATMGVVTLAEGSATISTSKVTANSRIILDIQSLGTVTVPTTVGTTSRTPGVSFTITSANPVDTSVISWIIFEPAP